MLINRLDIDCYIHGAGMISPQKTYDNHEFLPVISQYDHNVLTCVLPDFKAYIHPLQLRRLSRMLRIGLAAATICLCDAKLKTPDAVITATGYGFQDDLTKFLSEILQKEERQLTPTYFMQSTYNALAGLIALSVKCMGYNNTHASKGFAFETALQDAVMLLKEKEAHHVLVGSYDEVSPVQYSEYVRIGHFKNESVNNLKLFDCKTAGALQGEGAAFFMLSASPAPHAWCRLKSIHMVYKPADGRELAGELDDFLKSINLCPGDINVFVNGVSGDVVRDRWNVELQRACFEHAAEVRFKHLSGEYATASSFSLWLGAMILKHQKIPDAVLARPAHQVKPVKTVLICNHFLARDYSFMVLESGD
jgi:3-oxoacyl-[acyl-carrier-protein] synthase II